MPRAIRGTRILVISTSSLVKFLPCSSFPADRRAGVLIECDPSIKSIIVNIDSVNHDFIIEDLDEERVVVKENMVALLKKKLESVRLSPCGSSRARAFLPLSFPVD